MTEVLMISDPAFAADEARLLRRLEIGLVSAGLRPTHLIPESVTLVEEDIGVPLLRYRLGTRLSAGPAARRVVEQVSRRLRGDDIQLVHAFGRRSWSIAVRLARMCNAPLLIEVFDREHIQASTRLPSDLPGGRPVLCAVDPAFLDLIAETRHAIGRSTPWGVHAGASPRRVLDPGFVPSIVVIGSPYNKANARAALTGIASILPRWPDALLAVEGDLSDRARLWSLAGQLGVQPNLSLVIAPDRQPELVSRADLVIITDDGGRLRSVVLEAMAHGSVVVAPANPGLAALRHKSVVTVPNPADPADWANTVSALLSDPLRARSVSEAAHRRMRESFRVSAHIGAVVDAYEWTLRADAVPLSAGRSL